MIGAAVIKLKQWMSHKRENRLFSSKRGQEYGHDSVRYCDLHINLLYMCFV